VSAPVEIALKHTPLHRLHVELGASMVPFAGYEMPVRYPAGILKEHVHVRMGAGLFDVSHMGQFELRAKTGSVEDAAWALESVIPVDIIGLRAGRQRYALLTNNKGGIRDDLMVANLGDRIVIVANAACKDADATYLRAALSERCTLTYGDDRALLALQGPTAEDALAALAPAVRTMRFLDVRDIKLLEMDCVVSRSGYTGEDGFEISVPADGAEALTRKLLSNPDVAPIGLGARDSLRLEAGLCLYGSDLDTDTTPVEADLQWSIQAVRNSGGSRSGGFPGADVILGQLASGAPRKRVGLRPEGRAPIRHGAGLYANKALDKAIGIVTSGGFGPTVNAPVAMGYVTTEVGASGAPVFAKLRGECVPVNLAKLPFVPNRFKR